MVACLRHTLPKPLAQLLPVGLLWVQGGGGTWLASGTLLASVRGYTALPRMLRRAVGWPLRLVSREAWEASGRGEGDGREHVDGSRGCEWCHFHHCSTGLLGCPTLILAHIPVCFLPPNLRGSYASTKTTPADCFWPPTCPHSPLP